MASNDVTLNIGANLTPAQRQLQAFVTQAQRQVGSKSFEFKLNDRGFRQPLGRITGDLNQFQGAMDASIARTLAFGASVGAIAGVTKAFKDLVSVTVNVEHALKEINVLLNLSTTDLSKFSKELFGVAKNTASSFDTVAVAATEFSRQGLSAAETAKRVNSALILTRLSGLDAEASVSALTAAVNGFKRESISTTEVVNRLANVDAQFAVSSGDLAKALSRAGSVSQDAKVKFNELLAATTAVQQATARGGNVIGNGFKTIFTRLQRSKVREELESIGVATTSATGELRGAMDILKDYARVYQTLTDQQKAFTSEQVAGVFQINNLKALVNDLSNEYGVYSRALQVANQSTDEAVKRNAQLNDTLQSLASQTSTEITELAAKIGAISFEGNFKGILGLLKSALGDMNAAVDSESLGGDLARGVLKGFGNFLTGPGAAIALVGITKLLFFIAGQTQAALRQVLAIGSQSQKRQLVQQRINALLAEDNNLLKQIMSSSGNINDINKIVTRSINEQNAALSNQKLLVNQIAAAFQLTKGGGIAAIGGGKGGKRAADGFIPNLVRQESSSISRGVGGARGGDRPVVIPNFSFGGGKTGTMVAHTGEHIVPNFAGGGSAIFNRNMASSMGLPAGAKRVGAAQGFIPNFKLPSLSAYMKDKGGKTTLEDIEKLRADGKISGVFVPETSQVPLMAGASVAQVNTSLQSGSRKFDQVKARKKETQKKREVVKALRKTLVVDNADFVGVASAFDKRTPGAVTLQTSQLKPTAQGWIKRARSEGGFAGERGKGGERPQQLIDAVRFNGIQVSSVDKMGDRLGMKEAEFRKEIARLFTKPLGQFANFLMGGVFKGDELASVQKQVAGLRDPSIFSASAEGAIFESAVNLGVKKTKATADFQGKRQAYFDFEEGDVASPAFKNAFGFSERLRKADGKRTANTDSLKSIVEKSINDSFTRKRLRRIFKQQFPMAAGGFIPSFANLAGVSSTPAGKRALSTETALAGNARMGYDSRVGYGVYNNSQGSLTNAVSQHLNAGDSAGSLSSMGAAAQAAVGAALGFVPSFATNLPPGFMDRFLAMNTGAGSAGSAGGAQTGVRSLDKSRVQQGLDKVLKTLTGDTTLTSKEMKEATKTWKALRGNAKRLDQNVGSYDKAIKAATKDQKKRQRAEKKAKGGGIGTTIGISIVGQMVAGVVAESLSKSGDFESQLKADAINKGTQFGFTGATIGSMFGPLGATLGGIAGAGVGLLSFFDEAGNALKRFTMESEKAASAETQATNALNTYVDLVARYNQEVDPEKQAQLSESMVDALSQLPPEMAASMKTAGLDFKNVAAAQAKILADKEL